MECKQEDTMEELSTMLHHDEPVVASETPNEDQDTRTVYLRG